MLDKVLLSLSSLVLWATPISLATIDNFVILIYPLLRWPSFMTRDLPRLILFHLYSRHPYDSGSLLQFTQLFILVVWQGSRPSKLSPNLQIHLSKLPRVHAFALRLEYLKHKASADFSRNLLFVFLQGEQSIALVGFSPTGSVPPRGTPKLRVIIRQALFGTSTN